MQAKTLNILNLIQKTTKGHYVQNDLKSLKLPLSFHNLLLNLNVFDRQPAKPALLNNIGGKINSLQALSEFKKADVKETSIAPLDFQKLQTLKNLQKIIKFVSEQTISSGQPLKIILKTDPLTDVKTIGQFQNPRQGKSNSKSVSSQINLEIDSAVNSQTNETGSKTLQSSAINSQTKTEVSYEVASVNNPKTLHNLFKIIEDIARNNLSLTVQGKNRKGETQDEKYHLITTKNGKSHTQKQTKLSESLENSVVTTRESIAQKAESSNSKISTLAGLNDEVHETAGKSKSRTKSQATEIFNRESKETTKKTPAISKNTQLSQEMTKADVLDKSAQDKSADKTIFRVEYPTKQTAQSGEDATAKVFAPKASIDSKSAVIENAERHSENNSGISNEKTSKSQQNDKILQSLSRTETGKIEAQKTAASESQPFAHKISQTSQQSRVNNTQELLNQILFESNEKKPVSEKSSKSSPDLIKIKAPKKDTQKQSTDTSKIIVGKYSNQSAQKVTNSNINAQTIEKSNKLTTRPDEIIDNQAENENSVSIEEQPAEHTISKTPQKLTKNAGLINPGKFFIRHDSANNLKTDSVKSINEALHASEQGNPQKGENFLKSKNGKLSNKPIIEALNKAIQDREQAPALSSTKHNRSDEDKPEAQNDIETSPDFSEENIHNNESQMRSSTNSKLFEGLSENIRPNHAVNFDSTLSFNKVSTLLGNKTSGAPLVQRSVLPEMLQKIMANARLTMSGQKLEILLDVESLGKLAIDAVKKQEKIHLQISVENNEARQWLENHIRPLIEQINKAGIEVEKFEVSVGNPKLEQQQREKEDPALPGFRNKENIHRIKESRNDILQDEKIPPYMLKRNFGYNTVEVWI